MKTPPGTLDRRGAIVTLGALTAAFAAACETRRAAPSAASAAVPPSMRAPCRLTPEQEEGPFYIDEGLLRADITEGQVGIPFDLTITVVDSRACTPLAGAAVDVWQANAGGVYSDAAREGTVGRTYLRGVQLTDERGRVTFKTIYPGWYPGRSCHVHIKVHTGGAVSGAKYSSAGGRIVHGGQMFFPTRMNEELRSIYTDNRRGFMNNDVDRVYAMQGGASAAIEIAGSLRTAVTGAITVAVPINPTP